MISEMSPPTSDVLMLVKRACYGDEAALDSVLEWSRQYAFRLACALLRDDDQAEDAAQEVIIKVHRHLHTYQNDKAHFKTWVNRITYNVCRSMFRRKRLRSLLSWDFLLSRGYDQECPIPQPIEQVLSSELKKHVWQALGHLSFEDRTVVVLSDYEEMRYREIADIMGCPIGTVKSRRNRAIIRLRAQLGGMADDYANE